MQIETCRAVKYQIFVEMYPDKIEEIKSKLIGELEEGIYNSILAELKPGSLWDDNQMDSYMKLSEKQFF